MTTAAFHSTLSRRQCRVDGRIEGSGRSYGSSSHCASPTDPIGSHFDKPNSHPSAARAVTPAAPPSLDSRAMPPRQVGHCLSIAADCAEKKRSRIHRSTWLPVCPPSRHGLKHLDVVIVSIFRQCERFAVHFTQQSGARRPSGCWKRLGGGRRGVHWRDRRRLFCFTL